MRLPIHKIYRAFPELDRFDDFACEEFMREARSRKWRRLARFVCTVVAGFACFIGTGFLSGFVFGALKDSRFVDTLPDGIQALLYLSLALFFCLLAFTPAIFLRDYMLRRQIKRVLNDSSCPKCGYSLLGLPVSPKRIVICTECGTPRQVDPALGHLTISGPGGEKYQGRGDLGNKIPDPGVIPSSSQIDGASKSTSLPNP